MSFIGSSEQFSLARILRQVESHGKTGLLKIKHEEKWVELYFRHGQLISIGPVRSNFPLGDRLLQAGVISQQALQEALTVIGASPLSETRLALTLIDLGHVSHESLYTWSAKEAARVIGVLLSWRIEEITFEEERQPAIDRLLIALPIASLLPSSSSEASVQAESPAAVGRQANQTIAEMDVSEPPTQVLPAVCLTQSSATSQKASSTFLSADSLVTISSSSSGPLTPPPLATPKRVTRPLSPIRIDSSFMTPDMLLIPTDLSELRDQNREIELTPEQWRLMTQVNGRTSLQRACLELGIPPELVCRLAGELIALGLITVSTSTTGEVNAAAPIPKRLMDMRPSSVPSGSPAMATAGSALSFSGSGPVETVSQWGNGGNRATFVLGGGWVLGSHLSQYLPRSGPLKVPNDEYAPAGGVR